MFDDIPGLSGGDGGGADAAVADDPTLTVDAGTGGADAGDAAAAGDQAGAEAAGAPVEADAAGVDKAGDEAAMAELEADGRKVTDVNLRKGIAELAKTDKVAAKAVRDAYFGRQAVMQEFPEAKGLGEVLKNIRGMKATIDSLGGEEGITGLQDEVQDYRNEIAQFAAGDSALIEQLYQANPESTAVMVGNALTLLESKNKVAFDNVIAPALAKRLGEVNFTSGLVNLANLIKEGKGQEAYDLVAEFGKWTANINDMAKKAGETRAAVDPRKTDLDTREQTIAQKERESFERTVGQDVTRQSNAAMSPIVEPLFKQLKLSNEGRREFVNSLQSRIWAAMKADKVFQRQARAIMDQGDGEKSARFIALKYRELLPDAFRRLRNDMYPNLTNAAARPKPGANGAPAKPGAPVITSKPGQKPKREDVDWEKTADVQWVAGKGVTLKNGQVVNFKWADV